MAWRDPRRAAKLALPSVGAGWRAIDGGKDSDVNDGVPGASPTGRDRSAERPGAWPRRPCLRSGRSTQRSTRRIKMPAHALLETRRASTQDIPLEQRLAFWEDYKHFHPGWPEMFVVFPGRLRRDPGQPLPRTPAAGPHRRQRARGGARPLDDPRSAQGVDLRLPGAGQPVVLLPGQRLQPPATGRAGYLPDRQALPVQFSDRCGSSSSTFPRTISPSAACATSRDR